MTSEAPPRRRSVVGLSIATAIAFAILIGLGSWQVQRLHWKEALLARVAALEAAPAQSLAPVLARAAAGEDVGFTRVVVDCPGIDAAPYVELYALLDGQAGSRLISLCRIVAGPYDAILVDRGFVRDIISARPPQTGETAPVRVIGVLRAPEPANAFTPPDTPGRWYRRDVPGMAKALGAGHPAPVFLMAETSTNPQWKALVPAPLPAAIPNRHLEYAITWFGLAAVLACVYAALLLKRRKD